MRIAHLGQSKLGKTFVSASINEELDQKSKVYSGTTFQLPTPDAACKAPETNLQPQCNLVASRARVAYGDALEHVML